MNKTLKLTAALSLVTLLVASSAFAESRPRRDTYGGRHVARVITVEGHISDLDRDRNGIVIRLDRGGYVLFASRDTEVYSRARRERTGLRQLERGDRIRATGQAASRGRMRVDTITIVREEDDRRDRNDRTLRGVVQSVDASRRIVWLHDDRSGRVIEVDLRRAERNDFRWDNDDRDDRRRRWHDLSQLRRGDRMTVQGDWRSDGRFEGERYDIKEMDRW
jgi:hypothetical protein